MMRKFILILILFPSMAMAQERLSLNDAIGLALKNNYSIRIAKNNEAVAKNDNSTGNAGMLPTVTAGGGISQTENAIDQEYADGRVVDRTGVGSTLANAGAELNWTLFDGLKMFATKNKLEEIAARGELASKIEIENTVKQVIASYFMVVKQQKLIEATELVLGIDSERVVLAQIRLDAGSGSRLDLLQAKVDMNEQLSIRMKQQAVLQESKDQLNYLMARKPGTDFSVSDSIVITYQAAGESLRSSVLKNNGSIMIAQHDQKISLLTIREFKSQRFPVIGFSGGYNYARTKNEAGFLLLSQSTGYHYGLSMNWNLFDGFNVNRRVKNAKLHYESSGFYLQDLQLQVSAQLEKALRDFTNNTGMLKLEQENILLARENLAVAFERFRTGLSNSLELKNAQLSFQQAELRLVQAQYDAKISETELMKLNGELVK